jgi:hypothetical protein
MADASLHVQELPADEIHKLVLQGLGQKQFEMAPGLESLLDLPGVQDINTQQILEGLEAVVTVTSSTFAKTLQDEFPAEIDDIVEQWLPAICGFAR